MDDDKNNLLINVFSPAAIQKCCPDKECYDLGSPWQSPTRPVPDPRCLEDPVKYLLTNRYEPKQDC
jgi:hypothetical protein